MAIDTTRTSQQETIRLDTDGNWFQGEYPILHDRTCRYLYKHIDRDEEGRYYLTGEDKPIFIKVEDAPYWITKLERTIAGYLITLTDETIELLDPHSLWSGKNNALYCSVKGDNIPAKFQRNTYYELMKDLEQQEGQFFIKVGSKKYPIQKGPPKEILSPAPSATKVKKQGKKIEKLKKKKKSVKKIKKSKSARHVPKKAAKRKKIKRPRR